MPLELNYLGGAGGLPVEVEGLSPDRFQTQSPDAVRRCPVWVGNACVEAGELFEITGQTGDIDWRIAGDLAGVHELGAGMQAGSVVVEGPVGRRAAAGMRGGQLAIRGDAGDWLGAELRGGRIEVDGHAGHSAGGAFPGAAAGMRGGVIVVHGGVGDFAGHAMRRGLIAVGGDCGCLAAHRMRAGTVVVFGRCGPRAGAEMIRGTICLFGEGSGPPLPTFRLACRYAPSTVLVALLAAALPRGMGPTPSAIDRYNGDFLCGGRGELLLAAGVE